MTTDLISLDSNFNAIIEETKIYADYAERTIYKNANRYKHNDIVYIPQFNSIKNIIKELPEFPKRYKKIEGTERFKVLKDYILTFNLLQQYFSPHEENKTLIALDNRYIEKSIGSRYRNGKNLFFDKYFNLEIKGIKGLYTSGYSLTEEGKRDINNYSIVINKNKLDITIEKFLKKEFNEYSKIKTLIPRKEISKVINDSYIKIPQENMDIIKTYNNIYSNTLLKNYSEGKLYFTKNVKDYGRTYSFIHNIPREMRNELFANFIEIDLESAAQAILYSLSNKENDELKYIKYYIDNKQEVREKLSKDLGISIKEVKRLIQVITFSENIPSKKQLPFRISFKGLENSIENAFINGLSTDLKKIDKILKNNLTNDEKEVLIKRNGKLTNIDIRCFKFQMVESKLMGKIQSILKNESFHLHDAVYVKEVSDEELIEIKEYLKKFDIHISYTTLDSKMLHEQNEFYLYVLLDLSKPQKCEPINGICFLYKPYYIGKGKGKRCYAHKYFKNTNHKKDATTKKLFKLGYSIKEISNIFYYGTENDCFQKEYELIKENEHKYNLTNIADGGYGGVGGMNKGQTYEDSYGIEKASKIKEKQSNSKKGKKFDDKHKKSLSISQTKKWRDEQYRENMLASQKGKKMPKGFSEKQSKLKTGRNLSDATKEKLRDGWKKKTQEEMNKIVNKRNENKMKKYIYNINGKELFIHTDINELLNILKSKKVYYTMNKKLRTEDSYFNKKLGLLISRVEIT